MEIRAEIPADYDAIRQLTLQAFDETVEADIVDGLRGTNAWLPDLSIVAEDETGVVGHLLLSVVVLDTGAELLSLGPMCVSPARQRSGIGTALVHHALALAKVGPYPLVVVLGHTGYYRRFGFESARRMGIETPYETPDEAWMALRLPRYRDGLQGLVVYPPVWGAPTPSGSQD